MPFGLRYTIRETLGTFCCAFYLRKSACGLAYTCPEIKFAFLLPFEVVQTWCTRFKHIYFCWIAILLLKRLATKHPGGEWGGNEWQTKCCLARLGRVPAKHLSVEGAIWLWKSLKTWSHGAIRFCCVWVVWVDVDFKYLKLWNQGESPDWPPNCLWDHSSLVLKNSVWAQLNGSMGWSCKTHEVGQPSFFRSFPYPPPSSYPSGGGWLICDSHPRSLPNNSNGCMAISLLFSFFAICIDRKISRSSSSTSFLLNNSVC